MVRRRGLRRGQDTVGARDPKTLHTFYEVVGGVGVRVLVGVGLPKSRRGGDPKTNMSDPTRPSIDPCRFGYFDGE